MGNAAPPIAPAPAEAPSTAADRLGRIAATGLRGARPLRVETPLAEPEWSALLAAAVDERVVGHLRAAIDGGAVAVTDEQRRAVTAAHERLLAIDLVLERLLGGVTTALRDVGIEHRVLKGPVLAHTVYADPARRSFSDVDLLVPGEQFDDAVDALVGAGGRRKFDEPRPGFTRRFGKGVAITIGALDVDLHRTLAPGPFGLAVDTAELFAARDPLVARIGGHEIVGLSVIHAFVHACLHAALGDRIPRLVPLRDVAELAQRRKPGALDLDAVLATAARWRCRAVVQRAVRLARHALVVDDLGPIAAWAGEYRPDRFERAGLRAYVAADRSYALQAAAGVRAVRGVRNRAAYVRAMVVPSGDYLAARDGRYARRMRRALGLGGRTLR
ncbi:MAG TPA: nucleotidyltransferase family protein [Acidimicrobiia bacterium]|nr:nucleotidyltransferase family protein [Acidimicrobiia bacterium]